MTNRILCTHLLNNNYFHYSFKTAGDNKKEFFCVANLFVIVISVRIKTFENPNITSHQGFHIIIRIYIFDEHNRGSYYSIPPVQTRL